jgi:hypothetical protein
MLSYPEDHYVVSYLDDPSRRAKTRVMSHDFISWKQAGPISYRVFRHMQKETVLAA